MIFKESGTELGNTMPKKLFKQTKKLTDKPFAS
jgi:hypothetical protein